MTEQDLFDAYVGHPTQEGLLRLLRSIEDPVYNVCYQVLRQSQDAEDASQTVLAKVLAGIPRLPGGTRFRPWVRRVAYHAAIDAVKERSRRRLHERRRAKMTAPGCSESSEIPHLALHEHIAALEEDLQSLVIDRYFEGKVLEALARERGCSTSTVWKELEEAKAILRRSLEAAGLTGVLLGIDSALEAMVFTHAPHSLIGPALTREASVVARAAMSRLPKPGARTSPKPAPVAIAAAGGVLVAWLLTLGMLRWNGMGPSESTAAGLPVARQSLASPATPVTTALPVGESSERRPETTRQAAITSFPRFMEALRAALRAKDLMRCSAALKNLGIPLTHEKIIEIRSSIRFPLTGSCFYADFESKVLRSWSDQDPSGMVTFIDRLVDDPICPGQKVLSVLKDVFLEWADRNPDAALAKAREWTHGLTRAVVLRYLALVLHPEDAEAAIRAIDPNRDAVSTDLFHEAGKLWAKRDPLTAIPWVMNYDRIHGGAASGILIEDWAQRDPQAAMEWAKGIKSDGLRDLRLGSVLRVIAERDFDLAASAFKDLFQPREWFLIASDRLLESWAYRDPRGAAEFVKSWPIADHYERIYSDGTRYFAGKKGVCFGDRPLAMIVGHWASVGPTEALSWTRELSAGKRREALLATVIGHWAQTDPSGALAAAGTLPEKERAEFLEALVAGWAEHSPWDAAAYSLSHADKPGIAMREIARQWADRDFEGSVAWAKGLSEASLRDAALVTIVESATDKDFSKALALAADIRDTAIRREGVTAITVKSLQINPELSLQLLSRLPDMPLGEFYSFSYEWAARDPKAAAAWAERLPEKHFEAEPGRPDLTREIAPRKAILETIVKTWAQKDSTAAARWVNDSRLPKECREELLKIAGSQRRQ